MSLPSSILLLPTLLAERFQTAFTRLELDLPEDFVPSVQPTADARHGDYQCNDCLGLAKALKRNPRQIAQAVLDALNVEDLSAKVEIAGPGFLNVFLRSEFLAQRVSDLLADERLGVPLLESKQIVLDFSSPNIAKPMHVGHIRSTFLGDALSRIARFLGYELKTVNHLGDWGTQFGMILWGWKQQLNEADLEADATAALLNLYREVNALAKEDQAVKEACKQELVKLQAGDEQNLAIWERCVELSKQGLEKLYARLGIEFNYWMGESAYQPRLAPLVAELEEQGLARESEGALVIFFDASSGLEEHPLIVRKGDGGFLYATTDLAAVDFRSQEWGAEEIWYVVGAPQQLHFRQIFAACERFGVDTHLEHIAFGSILGEDRKLMRTRSGESVGLQEVLDEAVTRARGVIEEKNPDLPEEEKHQIADIIGIGALKYAELSQNRLTDYVFSWDKMLSLSGRTAPYLQNSFVRIRSIFRKLEASGKAFSAEGKVVLTEDAERQLALLLSRYGEIVPAVLVDFRPNLLAEYLFELAGAFHSFYHDCPVLSAEQEIKQSRLSLCELTAKTLEHGLSLLGIEAPQRM